MEGNCRTTPRLRHLLRWNWLHRFPFSSPFASFRSILEKRKREHGLVNIAPPGTVGRSAVWGRRAPKGGGVPSRWNDGRLWHRVGGHSGRFVGDFGAREVQIMWKECSHTWRSRSTKRKEFFFSNRDEVLSWLCRERLPRMSSGSLLLGRKREYSWYAEAFWSAETNLTSFLKCKDVFLSRKEFTQRRSECENRLQLRQALISDLCVTHPTKRGF